MQVVHPICAGIDVHKAFVTVSLRRVADNSVVSMDNREFATTTPALLELLEWLVAESCPVVAMESTGVYWRPVYQVLSNALDVIVGNAYDMRRRPGKKTDRLDAEWISELLAHGLIAPSFVPPPAIAALRDLTRLRVALVQSRTQAKNRVGKVLEQANIKLGSVASTIFGASGRAMLTALVAGERDPKRLALLARGRLREKIPQLELALSGGFTEHHGAMIRMMLDQIDMLDRQIGEIEARVEELLSDAGEDIERLTTIPGVAETAARAVVGEIGRDMSRFGSANRLASWAGLCPGNNESGGKRLSGRTRKGNRYVRRVLTQCAWVCRRTDSFLGRTFRRLQARIGGKRAAIALAHKILVMMYHVLLDRGQYEEHRYDHPAPEGRRLKGALRTLKELGYQLTLIPAALATPGSAE